MGPSERICPASKSHPFWLTLAGQRSRLTVRGTIKLKEVTASDSFPPAQLLLEAARPLSGAEGVWTDSEIAVYPSGDRRSGAAAGHREADGSDRACAPLHADRLSGQPAGIPPGGKRRPGDGRSLQAAHQELHYLLELSLSVAEVGRDHGYREPRGASRRGGPRLDGCLAAPQPARRV